MTLELMWNSYSEFGEIEDVMLTETRDKKYGHVIFINIEDAKKFVDFILFFLFSYVFFFFFL